MIIDRNGNQVEEITLNKAEWCHFISKNGTKYTVTNANHRMYVSKPMSIKEVRATKEIKAANIKIA